MHPIRALGLIAVASGLTIAAGGAFAEARRPDGVVTPAFRQPIPNLPGKSLVSVTVDYAPGARSRPHRHAASGFIYAYVLSGTVRSQVDDGPIRVYRTGESFHEDPGAYHRVSENASETESAKLLAVFVVDSGESALTTYDER